MKTKRPQFWRRYFRMHFLECKYMNFDKNFTEVGSWGSIIPTLVQITAWRRPGDKQLCEPMMVRLPTHICFTRLQWVIMTVYFAWLLLPPNFFHDDVIKWKHFPHYWPFVRIIHQSPVNSPHKGQWRGALMFSLICFWINSWVNNLEAGDLRRHRNHCDVTVMQRFLV